MSFFVGSVSVVIGFISGVFTTLLLTVLVGIVLVIIKQKCRGRIYTIGFWTTIVFIRLL